MPHTTASLATRVAGIALIALAAVSLVAHWQHIGEDFLGLGLTSLIIAAYFLGWSHQLRQRRA